MIYTFCMQSMHMRCKKLPLTNLRSPSFAAVLDPHLHDRQRSTHVKRLLTTSSSADWDLRNFYPAKMPSKRKLEPAAEISAVKKTSNGDMVHMLQCKEGSSDKFYEITLSGNQVVTRYGKTGSSGVSSAKDFGSNTEALANMAQLLSEKLKKGYVAVNDTEPAIVPLPPQQTKSAPVIAISSVKKEPNKISGIDVMYLECVDGSSSKFYELVRSADSVTIRYGRLGADGIRSEKTFNGDENAAIAFMNKTVREKESKGYILQSAASDAAATAEVATSAATASNKKKPESPAVVATSTSSSVAAIKAPAVKKEATGSKDVRYLECTEGSSRKFYEITRSGDSVTIRYGRLGTDGISSEKTFGGDDAAAVKFVDKTVHEKEKKGYTLCVSPPNGGGADIALSVAADAPAETQSSGNLSTDLDNGLRVFIKGSSALPYTLKKFNGGYSCTCQGWAMQVHVKGAQATSCKHLKLVRGVEAEAERCQTFAGVKTSSAKKNTSIPASISLAQQWTASTDPCGYIMSEKLDGMRAYWCGKKLWTRSGLPIIAPEWFLTALPKDLVLDGELFLGRQQFDACMSIARRTDASDEWRQLRYVVFDAPNVKGGITTRLQRTAEAYAAATGTTMWGAAGVDAPAVTKGDPVTLSTDAAPAEKGVYWVLHPHTECTGMEHLLEELARVEAQGGEGLMLRSATAPHRGGRNSDLLKVKSFHDDEALVTDHEAGNGKYQGMVGSLVCVSRAGARFKVGSGLTDAMRTSRAAPQPGTVITFKYFELTKDGIPRFPTFLRVRPDVDKSEFPSGY